MIKKVLKWAAVVVVCFFGIIVAVAIFNPQSVPPPAEATAEVPSQPVAATAEVPATPSVAASQPVVQKTPIAYQIVDRWTIPNGGEGKVVVISPDMLNETDMVALGNKLKSDVQNDRNAFISVFDNASAASLRDKVLSDKATKAEQDLYDKHF